MPVIAAAVIAGALLLIGGAAPGMGDQLTKEHAITFQTPFDEGSLEFIQLGEMLHGFEKEHDVRVILLPDGPADSKRIIRQILAGKAADIMEIPLNELAPVAERSLVRRLDGYERTGQAFSPDIHSSAFNAAQVNGRLYAMPLRSRSTQLIFNGDILESVGYDPELPNIHTWHQLLAACGRIASNHEVAAHPFAFDGKDSDSLARIFAMLVHQEGGSLAKIVHPYDDDLAMWRVALKDDAGNDAMRMLERLLSYAPEQSNEWRRIDLINEFVAGRVAIFYGDAGAVSTIRARAPDMMLRVIEPPRGRRSGSCVEIFGAVITPSARDRELCEALLHHLVSAEAQAIVLRGGVSRAPVFEQVLRQGLTTPDAESIIWYASYPEYRPFSAGLMHACSHLPIDGWREVQQNVLLPTLKDLSRGKTTAGAAVTIIEERGNSILSTHYGYIGHVYKTTVLGMMIAAVAMFALVFFAVGRHPQNHRKR